MAPGLRRPPPVARVLQQVTAFSRRHAMFDPPARVVVAVSGGPDSLCLLHTLVRLRRLLRIDPVCFHFDHNLRPGSQGDAAYVRRQAARLDVAFVLRAASSRPSRGESVEAWARTVRYEALLGVLEEWGGGVAALGHTLDDQAETILMALVRGTGLEGLAGMRPVSRPLVRPLLETTREETEAFCRSLGLRPRRDPMNADVARLRVAVRTRVLPAMERVLGRNVRESIARTGGLLREDADLLESLASSLAAGGGWDDVASAARTEPLVRLDEDGARVEVSRLAGLPRAAASRAVRRMLYDLGVRPETAHVDAILSLMAARPGRRVELPGALLAAREKRYVRLSRPSPRPGTASRGGT